MRANLCKAIVREFECLYRDGGKQMKKVLIVEDHLKAARLVQKALEELDCNIKSYVANTFDEAKEYLLRYDYQLFVVDIVLNSKNPNDATGLDFIELLRGFKKYEYTPVVITTSVAEMKEHAYDNLDCYKYLEKPYDFERAKSVLQKALNMPLKFDSKKYMYIRSDGIVRALACEEIVYMRYDNRKISFQLCDGMFQVYYKTLAEICRELPEEQFLRCSKDVVINKQYIDQIDIHTQTIKLKGTYGGVLIGRTYRKKVFEELTND